MSKLWRRPVTAAFFLSLLALMLYACSGQDSRLKISPASVWSEIVSAHTSGTISKADNIQIRFVNDIVSSDKVSQSATYLVEIQPAIRASIQFVNPREIVIKPETWLEPATRYSISIKTKGLLGIPSGLDNYVFVVNTLPQNYEIETTGLTTDSKQNNKMILTGHITTADITKSENLEKILTASYGDQIVAIHWQHSADNLNHQFILDGVHRKTQPESIKLKWNGKPLGVMNSGESEIPVPVLGKFDISYAKVVYGQKQYIEVRFSDNLNSNQRVDDFIKLGDKKFTSRIEGNVLKVYPNQSLNGNILLQISESIKNAKGDSLSEMYRRQLVFTSQKPQVKFVGNGVIIPENKFLSIPFEVMNVHSVQVTAFRIYESNIGQFLQTNKLAGNENLERVGRYMWRKTISLSSPEPDHWNRYALDATELLTKEPGGMYRLTLSINRGNSTYTCSETENQEPIKKEAPFNDHEDLNETQSSGWDFADNYYNESNSQNWSDRNNPCKDAYFFNASNTSQSRNFIASNIGLLAKRDSTGKLNIVATDIRSGRSMEAVTVKIYNFQNQVIKTVTTDKQGFASVTDDSLPFYISASIPEKNGRLQVGYLKLSPGSALPVSHFDVGGHKIQNGVKGAIYGERGVWRPGDNIYLVFVVEDKNNVLPKQHPVSMSLINPRGQVVETATNNTPLDGMYRFDFVTDENAPTGNWQVRALLGGRSFSKQLKIETIVPNRLKVELDLGGDELFSDGKSIQGKLFSQWLHGAKADGLKADIQVRFTPIKTQFGRFDDYIFDDPTRVYASVNSAFFEGILDADGYMKFSQPLQAGEGAPGMLKANFTSRVFEGSGAFSISQSQVTFHPYQNYVGIKLPKGDQARGMLLTDTDHVVEVASLDAHGNKSSLDEVEVSLYKIHWKWWWDQSADSLARYANADVYSSIQHGIVKTVGGRGQWTFNVKYPDWGRYLVRACDKKGHHCSAKVVYIDWPGWAGRAQEQSGPGASVLNLSSDKTEYSVGETAYLTLPETSQGRALMSLETGSRILRQSWIELSQGQVQIPIKITEDMAPNFYANVTLIQPHQNKNNDRPIRLYGISSINVTNPKTHLHPVLKTDDEWKPETKVSIEVSEQQGMKMTYTLAVVDEGLLGLTNYKTPDLHKTFYKKEALGVQTWDLFDDVLNAYGGKLERILALGGGEDGDKDDSKKPRRFPPVVKFFGPFQLDRGQNRMHQITLPSYIGAVRVMLVAAHQGAYGTDSKSVFVRKPLLVLPTLPRLVGIDETFTVPVSVFVTDSEIKDVELAISVDDYFEVVGESTSRLHFETPGDKIAFLTLHAKSKIGQGEVKISASAGKHQAKSLVNLSVRAANPLTTRQLSYVLPPGERWETDIIPFGLENSNTAKLEISSLPPLNLSGRLEYLVRYPYGCLEQVTSSVFPQLYLPKILHLNDSQQKDIDNNIHVAIDRLRQFQQSNGSFQYWPGNGRYSDWANNYAGQFLLEASKQGYDVPQDMLSNWTHFQIQRARRWVTGDRYVTQSQAYRLYTLALANQAEMSAMNRLRENKSLDNLGRWYLGAAYHLAGQNYAAEEIINSLGLEFSESDKESTNFGSALRDKAIALNALVLLGRDQQAGKLAEEISKNLASDLWYSTQSLAFALSSVAGYMGSDTNSNELQLEIGVGTQAATTWKWSTPILQQTMPVSQLDKTHLNIKNANKRTLYLTLNNTGIAKAGEEMSESKGLKLETFYRDGEGKLTTLDKLSQGMDLRVEVRVTNTSGHRLENLALTHMLAAGWEIHNDRLGGSDTVNREESDKIKNANQNAQYQYRDIRDDRVFTFFGLNNNESKMFTVNINAAYTGHYYLPGINVEDMYDASVHARIKGQWITIASE